MELIVLSLWSVAALYIIWIQDLFEIGFKKLGKYMLILLILLILSFFFPSLWFIFVIYLIYWILSAKRRRVSYIEPIIDGLIENKNHKWVDLEHIHYWALQKYAIENGAEVKWGDRYAPDNEAMSFNYIKDNLVYPVNIFKLHNGAASLMVAHTISNNDVYYDYILSEKDNYTDIIESLIKYSLIFKKQATAAYVKYNHSKAMEYALNTNGGGGSGTFPETIMCCIYRDNKEILVYAGPDEDGLLYVRAYDDD